MTVSTSHLMFKGLEEEVYTGLADGQIVGIQERIDHALPGFQTEPDRRNPEFVTPPLRSYEEMGSVLVSLRSRLRDVAPTPGQLHAGSRGYDEHGRLKRFPYFRSE